MQRLWLRSVYSYDLLRLELFRRRWGSALQLDDGVSPNLRFSRLRIEAGGRVEIGRGFGTERMAGNHLWIQAGATLQLQEECWLRTECGENRLTLFPGARMQIGPRSLINGAMLSAKSELSIGSEALIGFGVRVLDSDQHDLDRDHPERTEPVRIGNRVWIGADSMVLRGSTIGDDVVIGARSLVTGDIPSGVLALGVPAKPIREIGSRAGCN
ncbi:MAG: acyltransferase [Myxococcales bacterium]|nr:acyltransferase [Myxococcales bacterium]